MLTRPVAAPASEGRQNGVDAKEVVVHGMSYEALAEATGCAVGTAKSRVFRARRQLESWLLGEVKEKTVRTVHSVLVEETLERRPARPELTLSA